MTDAEAHCVVRTTPITRSMSRRGVRRQVARTPCGSSHYEERDTHITMIFAADEVREWPKNIEITITETHN